MAEVKMENKSTNVEPTKKESAIREPSVKGEMIVKPVVQGAELAKPTFKEKLAATAKQRGESILEYGKTTLRQSLTKALKEAIVTAVETAILGSPRNGVAQANNSYRSQAGYTPYGAYQQANGGQPYANPRPSGGSLQRVIFRTREDAMNVLTTMLDCLDMYGVVTLKDYYQASGMQSTFVDNRWGWTYLPANTVISMSGNGYFIELPNPIPVH